MNLREKIIVEEKNMVQQKWGIVSAINKKYRQKPFCDNKILTKI